ncbi:hypothetical protein C9374_013228 [Naegleria lovaniensis]|uniref:non-specific serine/threonine protein kinase n=1 Tax=Naegleria lovaniensis TaxID=51637 RepID=A0AA88GVE7_NAELO|nr:uncharacterized protein C9374_013228 [Naegleria lovaniensis]KAG2391743.1 hypothetical protein C9374_013228 [Naegleria lovaniensis]
MSNSNNTNDFPTSPEMESLMKTVTIKTPIASSGTSEPFTLGGPTLLQANSSSSSILTLKRLVLQQEQEFHVLPPIMMPNNDYSTLTESSLQQLVSSFSGASSSSNNNNNILDLYKIKSKIGEGSFGSVFKVKIKSTKEVLALKRISMNNGEGSGDSLDLGQSTGMSSSFLSSSKTAMVGKRVTENLNEFFALKELDHPCIVKVREAFLTFDDEQSLQQGSIKSVAYSMKFYENGSLADYIYKKKGNISYKTVKSVMIQLCLVLQYLHSRNLLHRDIKPQNIFIGTLIALKNSFIPHNHIDPALSSVIVILGDFGTVRKFNEGSLISTMVGSQFYMSPEVMYGEAYQLDADIWSMGVSIYQLATGVPKPIAMMAYRNEHSTIKSSLETALISNTMTENEKVECMELIDLIMQMFDLDPKKRLSIEDLLSSKPLKPYVNEVLLILSQYNLQIMQEGNEKLLKLVDDLRFNIVSNQGMRTTMRKTDSSSSFSPSSSQQNLSSTATSGRLLLVSSWWSSNLRIFSIDEKKTGPFDIVSNMPYLLDLKSDLTCEQILPLSRDEIILGLNSGEIVKLRRDGGHSFKELLRAIAHKDRVKCLKLFPNVFNSVLNLDDLFASGSYNKSVKVWKRSSFECVKQFEHESGNVYALATTYNLRNNQQPSLISVGSDTSIYEWDLEKCVNVRDKAHSDDIYACEFLNLSQPLLLTGSFKELKGWDHRQHKPSIFLSQAHSNYINKIITLEPKSNSSCLYRDGNHFLTCSNDGMIKLWDVRKLQDGTSTTSKGAENAIQTFKVNLDGIKTLHVISSERDLGGVSTTLSTTTTTSAIQPSQSGSITTTSVEENVIAYGTKRGKLGFIDLNNFTMIKSFNAIRGVVGLVDVSGIQIL